MMDEEERDNLIDLLPSDFAIWDFEDELPQFNHATWSWWRERLGHPKAHRGCCKTCGCATTCMASAFHDALVSSVVRELGRIGALKNPTDTSEVTS
ncbi:hypothetical protein ACFW81_23920 [Streptomyces angustmyceticus]|uniref:hypothetical protein n=1 Tax=Streptomyces angustmyceticus TaxID=285578 RepID=UPI0036CE02AE